MVVHEAATVVSSFDGLIILLYAILTPAFPFLAAVMRIAWWRSWGDATEVERVRHPFIDLQWVSRGAAHRDDVRVHGEDLVRSRGGPNIPVWSCSLLDGNF